MLSALPAKATNFPPPLKLLNRMEKKTLNESKSKEVFEMYLFYFLFCFFTERK